MLNSDIEDVTVTQSIPNSEKYKKQYKYAYKYRICYTCLILINNANMTKHRKSKKHKHNLQDLGLYNLFKEENESVENKRQNKRLEYINIKYNYSDFNTIKENFVQREVIEKIPNQYTRGSYTKNTKKLDKQKASVLDIYNRIPGMPLSKISKMLRIGTRTIYNILEDTRIEEREQGFTRDSLGKKVYFKDMNYHR